MNNGKIEYVIKALKRAINECGNCDYCHDIESCYLVDPLTSAKELEELLRIRNVMEDPESWPKPGKQFRIKNNEGIEIVCTFKSDMVFDTSGNSLENIKYFIGCEWQYLSDWGYNEQN